MTGTKKSSLIAGGGSGVVKGGYMQHIRGVTGRAAMQTGRICTWDIGDCWCEVNLLKVLLGRFDIAVINPNGVQPFLLSA